MKQYSFKTFVQDTAAGTVCGLDVMFKAIAAATLIFSGAAKPCLALGLGAGLLSSIIINSVIALMGRFSFIIGSADIVVGAVLAQLMANTANQLNSQTLLPTLMAAIIIAAFFIGSCSFLLGYIRGGNFVRFLPFPVINGIVAGIGWLVVAQAFHLISNDHWNWQSLTMLSPTNLYLWAIAFGVLFMVIHLCKLIWVIPLLLLISIIGGQLLLHACGLSMAEGIALGFFNDPMIPVLSFNIVNVQMLGQINWQVLLSQHNLFLTMPLISILMFLLNISGLEIIRQQKADLNHGLKTQGTANLIAGLLCALPCYVSPTSSLLNINTGAKTRFSTVIVVLLGILSLFVSSTLISYIPRPLISGLLLYLGAVLINQFLVGAWFNLPKVDFLILVPIFLIIAFYGIIAGTIAGILISCLVFVITYARINAVKNLITRQAYSSRVERNQELHHWLQRQGDRVQIFRLQGYLFFGSAKFIFDESAMIGQQLASKTPYFFIYDFMHVTGIDSSAVYSFIQLQQLLAKQDSYLLFTQLSAAIIERFNKFGVVLENNNVKNFVNLDHGLEWCEDYLLNNEHPSLAKENLSTLLATYYPEPEKQRQFLSYMEEVSFPANHLIFQQGDISDCLYLIEAGEISVSQKNQQNNHVRLSKTGSGTIIGEMGFYLNINRSATVISLTACKAYCFSKEALMRMEKENANLAVEFHRAIICLLSERLIDANEEIQMLND